jgi:hypothetical protein
VALSALFRKKHDRMKEINLLLVYLSLPAIAFFTLLSLFRNTLPHWTGPVFICLIILGSEWLSDLYEKHRTKVFRIILIANVLFIGILVAGTIQIRYGTILPAEKNSDPTNLGHSDFTLDMYGWKQAKIKFSQFLIREKIPDNDTRGVKIIENKWFPAAHLDFYIAHPLNIDIIVPGNIGAIHKYYWINKTRHIAPGDRVYFITSSQHYFAPEEFMHYFTTIIPRDTIPIERNGVTVKNLFIFELTGLKTDSIAQFQ